MPETLKQPVQEDLGFPLLVPLDVRHDPRHKVGKPLGSLGLLPILTRPEGGPTL